VNAELEGYLDQLLSIRQDAPGIVANLPDATFDRRPAPKRWSIAECFDHLNVTARHFMPCFDRSIEKARECGFTATGPSVYPLLERFFLQQMEPPPRLRFRAPRAFAPGANKPIDDVLREFMQWQDQLGERIRSADGIDLRRARCGSPVLSWITYSLGTSFALTLAHERRHLWQARQVRNELDRAAALGNRAGG
jgi:hypothetical protein